MSDITNVKEKVISSLIWKMMERIGTQGVQFVVQLILARLLLPEDYGILAITTIFISIANVFIQTGFTTSIVQKKEIDEEYTSSMFYLMLIIAIILYMVLFLISPIIASFYNEPRITPIIRILGISLIFGAITSVQNAILSRNMQFKKYFYSSILGIIFSGTVGIILAYIGLGVWALVAQQLTNNLIIMIVLCLVVKWRPKWLFSFKKVKELFKYGWKILVASLIDNIYNDIYGLIIGKIYDSKMLGYYNRGKQFPEVIVNNINGSISGVMLSALSNQQDNKEKLKNMVRRSIITSGFIIFPVVVGLAVVAEPLVKILLTEKWGECVPFMQILCFTYAFYLIDTANLQAIKAIGRSDVYLKLEIIKKVFGFSILLISVPFGIKVMLLLQPVYAIISNLINAYPNRKFLDYSIKEQYKDILPSIILSIIMGIIIYPIKYIIHNSVMLLICQIIMGIIIYMLLSYILKFEALRYLINTVKELRNKSISKTKEVNE